MIRATSKPARNPQIPAPIAFLVLGLVSWLVIFPLLSPLHLAFASHKHHFCAVHHRYEDILPDGNSRAKQYSGVPFDYIPGLYAGNLIIDRDDHVECPFANLTSTNLALCSELDNSPVSGETGCGQYDIQLAGSASISILARAPKHSPPAQVS